MTDHDGHAKHKNEKNYAIEICILHMKNSSIGETQTPKKAIYIFQDSK